MMVSLICLASSKVAVSTSSGAASSCLGRKMDSWSQKTRRTNPNWVSVELMLGKNV
ncbi:hypothetical protein DPMN_147090 [Dreissena polymorpha]|uniref:Secreted protein n=1 Tax=Dreissena polymorpha TaxID=45954 RepID=A0A9D4F971_DREPO|nr:hypothetical protein DPMN_147090 [Dreissena polymorpha]